MEYIFLIALISLVLSLLVWTLFENLTRTIPGPFSLPIVGSYFTLRKINSPAVLKDMAKRYGNVFSLKVGSNKLIMLVGYNAIKEALSDNADALARRPEVEVYKIMGVRGVGFGDKCEYWKIGKREMIKIITRFCNPKNEHFLECLKLSSENLITSFHNFKENACDPLSSLILAVTYLVMRLSFKDSTDDDIKKIANLIDVKNFSLGTKPFNFLNHFPWLKPVSGFSRDIKQLKFSINLIQTLVEKFVNKRREIFDANNIQDVVDAFLALRGDSKLNFNNEQILGLTAEFVMVSFDSTIITLNWIVLLMAAYPEIQTKVQEEIDSIIGINRRPTMEDRNKLPYSEATLLECQRHAAILFAVYHKTDQDISIQGLKIKKNTIILPHFQSALHDEDAWTNSKSFDPTRFLNANKEVDPAANNKLIQYGTGLRRCTGEIFSRWTMFHYFVNLMQSFRIEPASGFDPHTHLTKYDDGLFMHLDPYKVKIKPRN